MAEKQTPLTAQYHNGGQIEELSGTTYRNTQVAALLLALGPEELRVLLPQLRILGNLGRRRRQEVSLGLEAALVGLVRHRVGDAVVSDEGVGALDVDGSRLRLWTGQGLTRLVSLKRQMQNVN